MFLTKLVLTQTILALQRLSKPAWVGQLTQRILTVIHRICQSLTLPLPLRFKRVLIGLSRNASPGQPTWDWHSWDTPESYWQFRHFGRLKGIRIIWKRRLW